MTLKCRIDALQVGQRVDLQGDRYADPAYYTHVSLGKPNPEEASLHPEFQFTFEVVLEIERESSAVIRVDFESGFSCGFPPNHCVGVDPTQGL